MFTSRNIHFAILGIILGSAFGYILAFYQVQASMPPPISGTSQAPPNHPEVTNEQMLALFKQALDKNPNEPELLTRYASFMFSLGRFTETTETLITCPQCGLFGNIGAANGILNEVAPRCLAERTCGKDAGEEASNHR